MKIRPTAGLLVALLGLAAFATPGTAQAGVIPSRADEGDPVPGPDADRAKVRDVLARQEVAEALAAHGLRAEEVERRLAQLSPEDLRSLARNVDQVQAAGNVPNYIWILLGILLAVTILATVF